MKCRSLGREERGPAMQPLPALRAERLDSNQLTRAAQRHTCLDVLFMRSKVTRHFHRWFAVMR